MMSLSGSRGGGGGIHSTRILSRSTDRNLDNLGLMDHNDGDCEADGGGLLLTASGIPVRASNLDMLSLLTREPPDGKEKPDQPKSAAAAAAQAHKGYQESSSSISRKGSKCDIFSGANDRSTASNSTSGVGGSSGVTSDIVSSRSEAGKNKQRAQHAFLCQLVANLF